MIPILSRNARPDQPHIILSQQILMTNNSNAMLISNYLSDKIRDSYDLYNIGTDDNLQITFKYKEISF